MVVVVFGALLVEDAFILMYAPVFVGEQRR